VATALGEVPDMLNLGPGKTAGTPVELTNWELPVEKLAEAICLYATNETIYRNAALNCVPSAKRYAIDLISAEYWNLYQRMIANED
jgi:hypothetical protein